MRGGRHASCSYWQPILQTTRCPPAGSAPTAPRRRRTHATTGCCNGAHRVTYAAGQGRQAAWSRRFATRPWPTAPPHQAASRNSRTSCRSLRPRQLAQLPLRPLRWRPRQPARGPLGRGTRAGPVPAGPRWRQVVPSVARLIYTLSASLPGWDSLSEVRSG